MTIGKDLTRHSWRFWMNCEEFLRVYREALDGKVSERDINDNVNYYRAYISGEVRKGKSEADVIKGLGDPRLLAKTLEESTKFANGDGGTYGEYSGDSRKYDSAGGNEATHAGKVKIPSWLVGIIVAIVVIFILAIVFKVALFLAPYIIAIMIAVIVFKEIRNWINRY
jgi:uncharacterized membrane protein